MLLYMLFYILYVILYVSYCLIVYVSRIESLIVNEFGRIHFAFNGNILLVSDIYFNCFNTCGFLFAQTTIKYL